VSAPPTAYRRFGAHAPEPAGEAAAYVVPARDGFADPPGLTVRADVLAAVGGPEPVRAGGLADLVARLEDAGHPVVAVASVAPPRRPTPAALHREGSARLWLFRRHPERHPLPRARELGPLRLLPMALGALHANAAPPA
jgi:hypothetical protein